MTQNERILWILGDRSWHEKSEFYGFCVLHSRVAELRRRGHEIEYRREGNRHLYRLVASLPTPAGSGTAGAGSEGGVADLGITSSAREPREGPARVGHSPAGSRLVRRPAQLSLLEEAA